MRADEAVTGYAALWRELKAARAASNSGAFKAKRDAVPPRRSDEIIAEMAEHCEQAYRRYERRDAYRAAMWLRRAWLHRQGKSARIWDGSDPVLWRRAHEAGRTGRKVG